MISMQSTRTIVACIDHGKFLLEWVLISTLTHLLFHDRAAAAHCGQKKGKLGYWDITGTSTYEEAYALTVGYDEEEAARLEAVVKAKQELEDGTYQPPSEYYIHPNIPPKDRRFKPVHPSRVMSWDAPIPPPDVVTPTPSASIVESSPTLPTSSFSPSKARSSQAASPEPAPEWQSFVLGGLHVSLSRLSMSAAEGSEGSSSSLAEARELTNEMKHILSFVFSFTNDDFHKLDRLLSVPSHHYMLKRILVASGLTIEAAEVFGDWMLGKLPTVNWNAGVNRF